MTAGSIGSRLGTESRPSHPLSHHHIHWNQAYRSKLLNTQSSLLLQYEIVAAQCVELIAWLGWLRSSELFQLTIDDIELVPPKKGPYMVYHLMWVLFCSLYYPPLNRAVTVEWTLLLLGNIFRFTFGIMDVPPL